MAMGEERALEIGCEIDGRYRIERAVGEGGYATVYRASQKAVGRPVAVKVMKPDGPGSEESSERRADRVERFRREARVLARLQSPATVTLHDFGETRGHFYMVLEFVDGVPLTALHGEQLAPGRVVAILEQALESLGEAHDHGIVHRDVKPDNLMLYQHRGHRERLKILDFGIAKVLRALDEQTLRQITGESTLVGTPRYVAPENATNRDPGPPADIYGLGLVAYEMLLGERAVPGGPTLQVLGRHLSEDFQVRIGAERDVPRRLRSVVNRMIRKPLAERYATADAVLADLDRLPNYDGGYAATESTPRPSIPRAGGAATPATDCDSTEDVSPTVENDSLGISKAVGRPAENSAPAVAGPKPTTDERPSPAASKPMDSEETPDGDQTARKATIPPGETSETDEPSDTGQTSGPKAPTPGRTAIERPQPSIVREQKPDSPPDTKSAPDEEHRESPLSHSQVVVALVVVAAFGLVIALAVAVG
jgi:serine/threonine protein kinase